MIILAFNFLFICSFSNYKPIVVIQWWVLLYLNRTLYFILSFHLSLPRNFALRTFGELLTVFSTKVNLLYLFYSTEQRYCILHLIKQYSLLNTFLGTLILTTRVPLNLFTL